MQLSASSVRITAEMRDHTWVMFSAVTIALGTLLVHSLSGGLALSTQVVLLATGVGLLGLPHGAFDWEVARNLYRRRHGPLWFVPFTVWYLSLGCVVLVAWSIAPLFALISFLGLAGYHFGQVDLQGAPARFRNQLLHTIARGFLPIGLICLVHTPAVVDIFNVMGGSLIATPRSVWQFALVCIVASIPWLAEQYEYTLRSARTRGASLRSVIELIELPILVVALAVLPPLVGFTLYYCLWHSAQHTRESLEQLPGRSWRDKIAQYAVPTLPVTLAAWGLGAMGYLLLLPQTEIDDAVVRVIFVGLSALLVPHAMLEYLASRKAVTTPAPKR